MRYQASDMLWAKTIVTPVRFRMMAIWLSGCLVRWNVRRSTVHAPGTGARKEEERARWGGLTARRLRYWQGSHGRTFLRPRTHGFLQLPSLFLKCADGGARTGPRVPPGPQSASSQRHRGPGGHPTSCSSNIVPARRRRCQCLLTTLFSQLATARLQAQQQGAGT